MACTPQAKTKRIIFPTKEHGWVMVKVTEPSDFIEDTVVQCWTSDDKLVSAERRLSWKVTSYRKFSIREVVAYLTRVMLFELEAA